MTKQLAIVYELILFLSIVYGVLYYMSYLVFRARLEFYLFADEIYEILETNGIKLHRIEFVKESNTTKESSSYDISSIFKLKLGGHISSSSNKISRSVLVTLSDSELKDIITIEFSYNKMIKFELFSEEGLFIFANQIS
ncbi:MAG: hypothetical protein HYZ42_05240 [Bacteroidetes bacterium]|nr:hypothetical protein [Bacteroidota bacterium]